MDSAIDPTPPLAKADEEDAAKTVPSSTTTTEGPTLEEEVKQLASSVSTWWSGFSKRSQEQLNEVKASIDSQGGIVSIAKREAARLEAQLNDAQKAARDDVKANADGTGHKKRMSVVDIDGWGTTILVSSDGEDEPGATAGSGKGKQKQVEGDEGAAVERLEQRTRSGQPEHASASSEKIAVEGGEALFDADALPTGDTAGASSEFKAIENAAQTAMHSMQSFWDRIQADPRVNNMQQSVAKTLQNIAVPVKKGAAGADGESVTRVDAESPQAKANSALPDISKQFQAAFPTLDLKESQAMAKRYFEASQSAARDWSKEMGTLMSDLVKVVPPTEEGEKALPAAQASVTDTKTVETTTGGLKPTATRVPAKRSGKTSADAADAAVPLQSSTDEEEFDWDEGESSVGGGLETTTAPPTSSYDDDDDTHIQTLPAATSNSAAKTKDKVEDEEDSDWE